MANVNVLNLETNSAANTEKIGELIGKQLRGGEVIELVSDLGGGKTTFVRGLARGMGSSGHVTSPTFKISNVYKAHDLELHHFDFYRLEDPGVIADELSEVMNEPGTVVVIEWGGVVEHVLPKQRLEIKLQNDGEAARQLNLSYPNELEYLVGGLNDFNN